MFLSLLKYQLCGIVDVYYPEKSNSGVSDVMLSLL